MDSFAQGLVADVEKATEKWRKQREREIRDAQAQSRRRDTFTRTRAVTIQEAAWKVMEEAYNKASANGTLPVQPRQIMYAARNYIQERTGRGLDDRYFTQTLLPDYVEQNCVDWDIVWNARGSFHEPHTNRHVPLGTLEVRDYLAGQESKYLPAEHAGGWRTSGPEDRYGAVLFVEKEGFLPLFRAVHLAERYDLAIMSTKGVSTTAARTLIDELVGDGVKVFCIRDFDVTGFTIAGTLGRDTRRYSWTSQGAIDLGLRLGDVEEYGLESERVYYRGSHGRTLHDAREIRDKIRWSLTDNGASPAEIEFLTRHRVELNAFTSDKLVEWIEAKLNEHGVEKVVPDDATLAEAALAVVRQTVVNRILAEKAKEIDAEAAEHESGDLADEIRKRFAADSALPWDEALQQIVQDRLEAAR